MDFRLNREIFMGEKIRMGITEVRGDGRYAGRLCARAEIDQAISRTVLAVDLAVPHLDQHLPQSNQGQGQPRAAQKGVLRASGVDVDSQINEYEFGRFGWIMDPEGHRIELWEPPA